MTKQIVFREHTGSPYEIAAEVREQFTHRLLTRL